MAEICPVCGLPRNLCVCGEMRKEQQRIRVRLETRKYGKQVTVIDGIDSKDVDLNKLATILKSKCATGGTVKDARIMLQGDLREVIKGLLIDQGFTSENIVVQ